MSGIDPTLAAKVLASFDEFNDAMSKRTPTDSDVSGFIAAHNAICYENQDLRAQLAATSTERDEARSRLAKARVDVDATHAQRDSALNELAMTRRMKLDEIRIAQAVSETRTAEAIAAWLDERYDVHEMGSNASAIVCRSAAADIRANAWRSK